jgi:protease II
MAKKLPFRLEKHGHIRVDDYYWLRERDNPAVIAYLDEENQRTAREMAHTQAFEEKLFEEIKARIKQTDMSGRTGATIISITRAMKRVRNIRSMRASAVPSRLRRRSCSMAMSSPRAMSSLPSMDPPSAPGKI